MNAMSAVAVTVAALASASLAWSQGGTPPSSTKEAGAASDHGMNAVGQAYVAAERDLKAIFAKHWRVAKEFTLAVAEAMPAEGYDFSPTRKSRPSANL